MKQVCIIVFFLATLSGCDASGFYCSRNLAFIPPSALSTYIAPKSSIEFSSGLRGSISSGIFFSDTVRSSALLENEASMLLVEGVTVAYETVGASRAGAVGDEILELDNCRVLMDQVCIELLDDGRQVTRVPTGGVLDLRFENPDELSSGTTEYNQVVRVKTIDRFSSESSVETKRLSVVLAERRINCVFGDGHGYRRARGSRSVASVS